jgi:hypothetical protein
MKTALAVIVLALACLLLANSSAQSIGSYQTLSGDSGRSILASLEAIDSQSNESSENTSENDTLWSWGSAPKGSVLVDGEILTDPFNSWKDFNITESGIAQVGVDPFKGYPIYAYKIPRTGETKYFYLDPYTNEPFYVDGYAGADIPVVAKSSSYSLPPVLR